MNNRHFKFRIWDKARNKWLPHSENSLHAFTDYFLTFDGKIVATQGEICDHPNMEYQTNFDWCDYNERPFKITRGSERFIIQQYTGLKDKNKREIYEGDILLMSENSSFYGGKISVIKYYNSVYIMFPPHHELDTMTFFMSVDYKNIILDHRVCSRLEVIGNIFENPDLLK